MGNPSSSFSVSFLTFITLILILCSCCTMYTNGYCYTSIISFGDSLADTGNLKQLFDDANEQPLHFFYPPYGQDFFHDLPTGRCSNGRLIIDFIAESMRLPLVRPFVGVEGRHMMALRKGVNFAVAGATALNSSFHQSIGVQNPMTNSSLDVQLEWFKQSLPALCANGPDCKEFLGRSLILMGEIGGNDYNHPLAAGKSIDDLQTYVPLVIEAIISAVSELIELGAKTLLVPGNLPIGCSPAYLTLYHGSDNIEYDNSTGCITKLNMFAEYHNQLLKKELSKMRQKHPKVDLIYADYYNAAMQLFRSPNEYGFINNPLKACCGGGGPFNYDASVPCADSASFVCVQPDTYINWDGPHLTEAAYKFIYKSVFEGPYTIPHFDSCPASMIHEIDGISSST